MGGASGSTTALGFLRCKKGTKKTQKTCDSNYVLHNERAAEREKDQREMSPFPRRATSEHDIILPGGAASRGGGACGLGLATGASGSSLAASTVAGGLEREEITFKSSSSMIFLFS